MLMLEKSSPSHLKVHSAAKDIKSKHCALKVGTLKLVQTVFNLKQ